MGEHRCAGVPPTNMRLAKRPSSLMSFCSPSYFTSNECCFACVLFHISPISFFSCTSFNSLYFPFCPALPLPKSCWAYPLQAPPSTQFFLFSFALPSRTSLYCGFYLYCVCNVFFFNFCFTEIFLKNVFVLDNDLFVLLIWFLFLQCCSFFYEFNASAVSVCIFVLI